ncbi:MAG: beta-propeller fold lactonase family protein [Chloroflexi bacterium]|nr:beta-propeller fold lactonase family protein [Chloroflexota bacterium]
MRRIIVLMLIGLTVGCSSQSPSGTPTSAPPPLAIPTQFIPTPTPTTLPPTVAPTTTPPLTAPVVRQRFPLRELPGIGRGPNAMAALGDKIYVANTGSHNVAVVQNNRVLAYIPVGRRPAAIAADPAQNRVYVANGEDKTISLIVNDLVTRTIGVGDPIRALLLLDKYLFVGLDNKGEVLVLDPNSLVTVTRIAIPKALGIINLAGDAARHRLYANTYQKIAVLDSVTWRVLSSFDVKENYLTLLANPQSNTVLTNIYDSKTNTQYLGAFDPTGGADRGRVKIGSDPRGAAINAGGTRIYVANSYSNDVSVVDPRSMTALATIPVGVQPNALLLDENNRRLYVANYGADNLNVIDTESNSVVATIPLGMIPTALLANETTGRVYVANASTDSVFVIEGSKIVKEIGVGRHPVDLARDEQSNRVFVANAADRTLSIINEADFSVGATQPITRFLTTVAVDTARTRVFAGDVVLDLRTLSPVDKLTMRGNTIGSTIAPDWVRVNPQNNRVYAVAWNGTPGSNSRSVTYSVDGATLQQRTTLAYFGNTSALAIDPETNRIYLAGSHPLAMTNELSVFDADDTKLVSLPLAARTVGMAYNPQTRHLFLAHAPGFAETHAPTPTSSENMIEVFDTRSFGRVGTLAIDSPGKMTRLGNVLYVAGRDDGTITLVEDANTLTPPSPTPTLTPTPYPTLPITTLPTRRVTPSLTPTPSVAAACSLAPSGLILPRWNALVAARLGCPTDEQRSANLAAQPFERGQMYWRQDERRIYVLFGDKTWQVFEDKWIETMPEDSCPSVAVSTGNVKPRRGFGKVWCEQASVRAKIGAATAAETGGYVAPVQPFERGMIIGVNTGTALILYSDGKWE